ncbi:MAG: patatin-like phospholipase family protein [Gemmatimonadales bacterium]|nr:patatin-like phospholipase family protein [Gemmatimonadales bacterium]
MSEPFTAVLSGGGVKAAAHLGALKVLEQGGLRPTRYVGTSMGAVIATGLAAGMTCDEVAAELSGLKPREVFALDRSALIRGMWARAILRPEPFRRTLERLLPVASFSELRLPLTITATDLDSGRQLFFGAGGEEVTLIDALCAACALPLYFPPFLLGGRRCADGGLTAVVPLAAAARFPAALVVAVDVGPGADMEPSLSRPRPPALLRLAGDAQQALMAQNTILTRALWEATPGRPPLLWIRPRVRYGETFAADQLAWYLEEGARAASAALAAWRA